MGSHPKNPEFRNDPENFHPCKSRVHKINVKYGFYQMRLHPVGV